MGIEEYKNSSVSDSDGRKSRKIASTETIKEHIRKFYNKYGYFSWTQFKNHPEYGHTYKTIKNHIDDKDGVLQELGICDKRTHITKQYHNSIQNALTTYLKSQIDDYEYIGEEVKIVGDSGGERISDIIVERQEHKPVVVEVKWTKTDFMRKIEEQLKFYKRNDFDVAVACRSHVLLTQSGSYRNITERLDDMGAHLIEVSDMNWELVEREGYTLVDMEKCEFKII